ncbi:restriction endonuclease subunit S [Hyalangium versicolor]|uniref:restriction endonuclease subunit S n=1 Tax=Hyalangium versicolor TaxID=2861190 RepID=UPI001CCA9DFC|nr:restriction endonuclease subunit S [Hyalangium versicolor]
MGIERRIATLGELCEFRAGVAFPIRFQGRTRGDFPFIKVSDLNRPGNELFIAQAENWVDAETASTLRARPVPAASVIFAKVGEAIRQNRKRLITRPTLLDNNLMAAIPRQSVDPRFLYYLLCTLDFEERIEGSALPYLKASALEQVEVELPPLQDQRRIAEILGTIDERLELSRQLNRTLEALASKLFQASFVEFYPVMAKSEGRRPVGLSEGIAARFPSEFVLTQEGPLPKGWRWGTLGDVARQVRERTSPEELEHSTPYIGLEHMPPKSIALAHWGTAAQVQSQKSRFRKGHLLFGKLRPYFHKVGLAPVDGVCSTDIVVVEPARKALLSFVLGHLSSVEFVNFADAGSDGTRMPRTSWEHMSRYPIALPDGPCVEAFDQFTRPLFDKLLANIHAARTLHELRDLLLPWLFSGESV